MKIYIKCECCGNEFDNYRQLSYHIKKYHKLTSKEYHDLILKTNNACANPNCNNITSFKNLNVGYLKYCSNKCNTAVNGTLNIEKIRNKEKPKPKILRESRFKCAICGKLFGNANHLKIHNITPQDYHKTYMNPFSIGICKAIGCDNKTKWISLAVGYKDYCSNKCHANTINQSDRMDKVKRTMINKYGENCSFLVDSIQEKCKTSLLSKYGVDNPQKCKEIQEKTISTNIKRYGVPNPIQRNMTNLDNLTKDFVEDNFIDNGFVDAEKFNEYFNCSMPTFYNKIKELGINYPKKTNYFAKQRVVYNCIPNNIKKLFNDRKTLNGLELDIFLPDRLIGIEFHGLYFHSFGLSDYSIFDNLDKEDKYIHFNKYNKCKELNIKLFQIFEDEWDNDVNRTVWKGIIHRALFLIPHNFNDTIISNDVILFADCLRGSLSKTECSVYDYTFVLCSKTDQDIVFAGLGVTLIGGNSKEYKLYKIDYILNYMNDDIPCDSFDKLINHCTEFLFDINKNIDFICYRMHKNNRYDIFDDDISSCRQLTFMENTHSSSINCFMFGRNNIRIPIKRCTIDNNELGNKRVIYDAGMTEYESVIYRADFFNFFSGEKL